MKQIKLPFAFLILLVGMVTLSCSKKDIYIHLTDTKWEVVKIKKDGESAYTKTDESYLLIFTNENTFTINLDVNNCFGSYEIISSGDIEISPLGCTEVCCDSEFAMELARLLPKMTSYYGQGDELILEGVGKIILKEK
ncbi:MAG: hypothetical protein DRJ02_10280 [Bacteroidetes bacterium]|nr:MAG: hypothetical protein DRI72_05945 [Bacteroidota bacterium]RLD85505.1 MAG: hypothetical protein DRJ02_10280 [Bacteroidota bacterium]